MTPSENPSLFCKAAVLPELRHGPGAPHMPVPGRRSHLGRLSERPNAHRNLIFIEQLDDLSPEITNFHANLPARDPHIQHHQIQNPFATLLDTPSDSLICVASAVRRTVLAATELVLSNLPYQWISSRNYTHLARGISTMLWSTPSALNSESSQSPTGSISSRTLCDPEPPKATVATFVQEPWVLSPEDFEAFCSLRELRNFVPKFTTDTSATPADRPWSQVQQLWAFVHDRCEEHQCHFFIVTSYEQWAFGCFSKAWTRAFITPPYAYNDAQQTVMERTLHWVLSATLQLEHQNNGYVAPEELPWMNSLYVIPEIVGEVSWAIAKPLKRRLSDEEEIPIPLPPAPRRSLMRSKTPLVAPSPAPSIRSHESNFLPDVPPAPIPPTLFAGVNAWRQRIPARSKTRKMRSQDEKTHEASPFLPPPIPHASPFHESGRPYTPPHRVATPEDSPGRLRLPPLLQSPARQRSTRSEHSGDTALDETDGLSMEVVAADVQPPQDDGLPLRYMRADPGHPRPIDVVQSRPAVPAARPLFSDTPTMQLLPHGSRSTSHAPPRSSAPRRVTRLINKRLREHHLAGTISTLTEESARDTR
ncbi:hypothetical protein RhiJN_14476 [Ceratobasidium sp. AG-Ba]|nr:hypothetical protein RhiJN_14476 [Ceratobasidium sp. AG-Ba]QRW15018.1 hypothetical protein RhiLY_14017 [Ceratobasidium sp. AG-Ba]